MTKCTRNMVNLKSSAYNQTGQNYFEQLAAYNSMSSHLRRILSAKSTIDARNKNYSLKKNQRCKVQDADIKKTYLHQEVTDDVIEKLAYDTRHHPMDVLRMNFNLKDWDCCNNIKCHQSRICVKHTCYEKNDQTGYRQRLRSKNERAVSPLASRLMKRKKLAPNLICEKELNSMQKVPHTIDLSTYYSQWRKYEREKDPHFVSCTSTMLDSSMFKSESQSLIQETNDHHLISLSISQVDNLNCNDKTVDQYIISKQCSCKKEEENKYIKFVYDITKEIIQEGLYTDKELQNVFKKHIEQCKGILNMNKMLYEIYQLKISLNIVDSETDDELENLIHAQKLLSISEIRPPAPPKVLDENKVMEKLESYRKMMEVENRPLSVTGKSVTIVDANPELFVTERDVLISLMEVGIDPKQAQHICKNLLQRSKDVTLVGTMSGNAESCFLDLEVDNLEKLRNNHVSISPVAETTENINDSVVHYSAKFLAEQETSSSISNLVVKQDKTMEVKTESQSEDDKMKNDKVES